MSSRFWMPIVVAAVTSIALSRISPLLGLLGIVVYFGLRHLQKPEI